MRTKLKMIDGYYDFNFELMQKIKAGFSKYRTQCVNMATGAGKSFVISGLAKDLIEKGKKVLIVASSVEAFQMVSEETGLPLGSDSLKVLSWRWLSVNVIQPYRERKFIEDVDYIFVDEAHKVGGPKSLRALKNVLALAFNAKIVAFTATSKRNDGYEVFKEGIIKGEIQYNNSALTLNKQGVLLEPKYYLHASLQKDSAATVLNQAKEEFVSNFRKAIISTKTEFGGEVPEKLQVGVFFQTVEDEAANLNILEECILEATKGLPCGGKVFTYNASYKDIENTLKGNTTKETVEMMENSPEKGVHLIISCKALGDSWHPHLDGLVLIHRTSSELQFLQEVGRVHRIGNPTRPFIIDLLNTMCTLQDVKAFAKRYCYRRYSKKDFDTNLAKSFYERGEGYSEDFNFIFQGFEEIHLFDEEGDIIKDIEDIANISEEEDFNTWLTNRNIVYNWCAKIGAIAVENTPDDNEYKAWLLKQLDLLDDGRLSREQFESLKGFEVLEGFEDLNLPASYRPTSKDRDGFYYYSSVRDMLQTSSLKFLRIGSQVCSVSSLDTMVAELTKYNMLNNRDFEASVKHGDERLYRVFDNNDAYILEDQQKANPEWSYLEDNDSTSKIYMLTDKILLHSGLDDLVYMTGLSSYDIGVKFAS